MKIEEKKRIRRYFKREFSIDVEKEYERLKSLGKISVDKILDRDTAIREVNSAAYNEQRAKQIYLKARKMFEEHKITHYKNLRALERKAIVRIKAWMAENDVGRSKQITKEDIVKEICYHEDTRDEYKRLVKRHEEVREIMDACESLANRWKSRAMLLNTQVRGITAKVEVNLGGKRANDD